MSTSQAFGWDSSISTDSTGTILKPGKASFTVTRMEKDFYDGGEKIPACPVARLTLRVTDAEGNAATVTDKLFLATNMAWKIVSFFVAAGLIAPDAPDGSEVRIPWDRVEGASGVCEVKVTSSNGRTYNNVDKYLPPEGAED